MSRRLRVLTALTAGLGSGLALGIMTGSVLGVRRLAAGHTYAEAEVPPARVALVLGALVFPDGT
ncbi:MAG: hypothetical protein ACLGIF_08650, partial [Actinomycetes bacterium]